MTNEAEPPHLCPGESQGETQASHRWPMPIDYILPQLREEMYRNAQLGMELHRIPQSLTELNRQEEERNPAMVVRPTLPPLLEAMDDLEQQSLKHALRALAIKQALDILERVDWSPTPAEALETSERPLREELLELVKGMKKRARRLRAPDNPNLQRPSRQFPPEP